MSKKPEETIIPVPEKPAWWKKKSSQTAFKILAAVAVCLFIAWYFLFRPFVSTDDARVDADIIKAANSGASYQIQAVYVTEGDAVKKDEVLVELDHATAQAMLEKSTARSNVTAIELKRTEAVAASEGTSKQQLDRVRAEYLGAQADLKLAKLALEHTYIRSPVDGIVIQKLADTGNILEANQAAVIIADTEHAWVSANIDEKKVGRVKPGQKVFITVDEGGVLTGQVLEVREAAASIFALIPSDNGTGNYTKVAQRIPVKISLAPHPGRTLRIGQSVEIKIQSN
jgi:membrane fusion protein (multidrug efflux system)